MVHNLGMRFSPTAQHPHAARSAGPAAPFGWFALGIVAVTVSLAVGVAGWAGFAGLWAGGMVFVLLVATAVAIASRRGGERLLAFLGGTFATVVGCYVAVLVTAHLSVAALHG
jgi:hypothetical protein